MVLSFAPLLLLSNWPMPSAVSCAICSSEAFYDVVLILLILSLEDAPRHPLALSLSKARGRAFLSGGVCGAEKFWTLRILVGHHF